VKTRTLGRTGLVVSEIGFGAWAIGGEAYGPTDDATSLAALRRAVERGVTFFDTADVYGKGRSEELVGKAVGRENVVLATKVGWDWSGSERQQNFTPEFIRRACEASLRRLGRIDLYQLHNPPPAAMREAVAVLRELQREGKVRFVGASLRTPADAAAAIEAGVDTIQVVHNYLEPAPIKGMDVGVIAREPLARGLLTGKFSASATFPASDVRSNWKDWARRIAQVDEFRALVRPDLPLARAALKFVLAQKAVSVAIPGAKTPAQVDENAAASDGAYDLEKDVFEGEGGDA
jgi:aryl-alcohol dehydrogenase-like predicted oxidoreductase